MCAGFATVQQHKGLPPRRPPAPRSARVTGPSGSGAWRRRLRYGSRGSLVVHPQAGTWHDFEADADGGTLALVEHVLQTDRDGALRWLGRRRPDRAAIRP